MEQAPFDDDLFFDDPSFFTPNWDVWLDFIDFNDVVTKGDLI